MFKWLKDLFAPNYSVDNLPKFEGEYPTMPKCKPAKQNISEPVYAIERSMIKYPSRWKMTSRMSNTPLHQSLTTYYTLKDIVNNEIFFGHVTTVYGYDSISTNQDVVISWATEEEKDYLYHAASNMQKKKLARVDRIYQVKKNKERERLMEIYK